MGESGEGSLEHGDSSGDVFWLLHQDFLKYFYSTFPEELPTPVGEEQPTETETADADGEEAALADGASNTSKAAKVEEKPAVFAFYKELSDELVHFGPKSGQYKVTFVCSIKSSDGICCGVTRSFMHAQKGRAISSSNLHQHIKDFAEKKNCPAHAAALAQIVVFLPI